MGLIPHFSTTVLHWCNFVTVATVHVEITKWRIRATCVSYPLRVVYYMLLRSSAYGVACNICGTDTISC